MMLDSVTRPAARLLAPATVRGLDHLAAPRRAGHLRRQPRQPHRHAAAAHDPARRVPPPHRRGRGGRLLLRPHLEVGAVVVRARRHPDRAQPRSTARSADPAAELLDDGWSLVIFPEGGRSPDGWGQPFHAGAAYLARRTGGPWCPCTCTGRATCCRRSPRQGRGPRRLWDRGPPGRAAAPLPHRRPVRSAHDARRGREHPAVLRAD